MSPSSENSSNDCTGIIAKKMSPVVGPTSKPLQVAEIIMPKVKALKVAVLKQQAEPKDVEMAVVETGNGGTGKYNWSKDIFVCKEQIGDGQQSKIYATENPFKVIKLFEPHKDKE